MNRFARLLLPLLLLAATPSEAQNLRIGMPGQPSTLDPHWLLNLNNTSAMRNMYDSLTVRDPDLQIRPGLAESWRIIDDTTWEFTLRAGVKFHDGSPLTSADIAATIQRVPNVAGNPNPYTPYLVGITGVEVIDALRFRIRTSGPLPILPVNLSAIFVVSAAQAEKPNAAFNSGEAAIGTGHYRLASWSTNQPLALRRHDGYWGTRPAWDNVAFTRIENDAARVAALLAGDMDFISTVPQQDAARIAGDRRLALFTGASAYVVNTYPDIERTNLQGITDAQGVPMEKNPFADMRVRRALSLAINRDGIASQIMEGLADATDQPVPRAFFGALSDRTPAAQDIARARALLVEAGYPDGFGINLFCSPSRTPRICQAIAAAWTRVGVRTTVEVVPAANFLVRRNRREYGVFTTVFGSLTGESSYLLGSQIHTRNTVPSLGTLNFTGASFPELDRIIQTARATLDDTERARLLREVNQRVVDDAIIIPVVVLRSVAAGRANLAYRTRADEEILAAEITPR